jgi:ATP-dependent DNA helicase RecG
VLSEIDMKLRGAGDLFGIRQSGFSDFKLASLADTALVTKAREAVSYILSDNAPLPARLHDRVQDYIIQDVNPD